MRYLIDTNVLIRAFHTGDPRRRVAVSAIRQLSSEGHHLCILPQNVAEFWAVCTRPAGPPSNGLGMTFKTTRRLIERFEPIFHLLFETSDVYAEWRRLLNENDIAGRQIHDARLAAAIVAHGLDQVLTFDTGHFSRFERITVTDPTSVATG